MSLADTQAQAAAVLDALPPAAAQRARQVLLELALVAAGPIGAYQPVASKGGSGHRAPTTGDPNPPHHVLLERIADASSAFAVERAVSDARKELAALRRLAPSRAVKGETEAERFARIVRKGAGWSLHEAANGLGVSPGDVRKARLAAARSVHDGTRLRGAESAGDSGTACRALRRQGLTQAQIALQLGVSQPTVSRLLRAA
jgi:DNA-directed RNA polymerase specialized sigma24 family protein